MKVTNEMKTVKKGAILVMKILGIESDTEVSDIAKFGNKAVKQYWDVKNPDTTKGEVIAVYTVIDDGMYGEGKQAIRELLVKTGRGNAWLFPISDLVNGHFEYEVSIRGEKAVISVTADIEVYDNKAAFKAAAIQDSKGVKVPKKALKPKKETKEKAENATTAEVVA